MADNWQVVRLRLGSEKQIRGLRLRLEQTSETNATLLVKPIRVDKRRRKPDNAEIKGD